MEARPLGTGLQSSAAPEPDHAAVPLPGMCPRRPLMLTPTRPPPETPLMMATAAWRPRSGYGNSTSPPSMPTPHEAARNTSAQKAENQRRKNLRSVQRALLRDRLALASPTRRAKKPSSFSAVPWPPRSETLLTLRPSAGHRTRSGCGVTVDQAFPENCRKKPFWVLRFISGCRSNERGYARKSD